jgi:hypothetical protein
MRRRYRARFTAVTYRTVFMETKSETDVRQLTTMTSRGFGGGGRGGRGDGGRGGRGDGGRGKFAAADEALDWSERVAASSRVPRSRVATDDDGSGVTALKLST